MDAAGVGSIWPARGRAPAEQLLRPLPPLDERQEARPADAQRIVCLGREQSLVLLSAVHSGRGNLLLRLRPERPLQQLSRGSGDLRPGRKLRPRSAVDLTERIHRRGREPGALARRWATLHQVLDRRLVQGALAALGPEAPGPPTPSADNIRARLC